VSAHDAKIVKSVRPKAEKWRERRWRLFSTTPETEESAHDQTRRVFENLMESSLSVLNEKKECRKNIPLCNIIMLTFSY